MQNRKVNWFQMFVVLSCLYLVALTFLKEMDIAFSVYFALCSLILAVKVRKVSVFVLIYGIYLGPYILVGLLFQEPWNTVSVIVTRYGFLMIGMLLCMIPVEPEEDIEKNILFAIRYGTFTEVVLAGYLLLFGDLENRLTINHQAVSGSVSVGLLVLSILFFYRNREKWMQKRLWVFSAVNLLIIVLSGTRGYLVMACLPLLPFLWDFFTDQKHFWGRILFVNFFIWILLAVSVFYLEELIGFVISILRLDESVGYRVYENCFIKEVFLAAPWKNRILGFGLGGRADHLPETLDIAWRAAEGKVWMVSKLLKQTTCHNYWYTLLFKQGIVGLGLVIVVLIYFFSIIWRYTQSERRIRMTLVLFGTGILISLTYRISATCGIFEIFILLWAARSVFCENINRKE